MPSSHKMLLACVALLAGCASTPSDLPPKQPKISYELTPQPAQPYSTQWRLKLAASEKKVRESHELLTNMQQMQN